MASSGSPSTTVHPPVAEDMKGEEDKRSEDHLGIRVAQKLVRVQEAVSSQVQFFSGGQHRQAGDTLDTEALAESVAKLQIKQETPTAAEGATTQSSMKSALYDTIKKLEEVAKPLSTFLHADLSGVRQGVEDIVKISQKFEEQEASLQEEAVSLDNLNTQPLESSSPSTAKPDNMAASSPEYSLSPTGMRYMFGSQSMESQLLLPPPSPCRQEESPTSCPVKDDSVQEEVMFVDELNTQPLDKPSASTPKQNSELSSPNIGSHNTTASSPEYSLSPTGMRYMFGSQSMESQLPLPPPSPCRQEESPTTKPKDDEATEPQARN